MTWNELGYYIEHLPLESATRTAQIAAAPPEAFAADGEVIHGPTSRSDGILMDLIDRVGDLVYLVRSFSSKDVPPPEPYPRPGMPKKQSARAKSPEVLAYMDAYRRNRGGVV